MPKILPDEMLPAHSAHDGGVLTLPVLNSRRRRLPVSPRYSRPSSPPPPPPPPPIVSGPDSPVEAIAVLENSWWPVVFGAYESLGKTSP